MERLKSFLKKKDIVFSVRRYGIDALGAMALGLFSTLIIGLILRELGEKLSLPFLFTCGQYAMGMIGPGIGIAVAHGLKAPPLVLFSSVVTGFVGNEIGGPAGAFVAVVIGAELGKLVSKETKVDIIITPMVTIITGVAAGVRIGHFVDIFMKSVGAFIMWATELMPLPMGILISIVMGIILTLPVSSAALSIMLDLNGLAAGAACAGCAAHMVGFAVASFRENKWGGLISQGLGTSMLQMPNIIKNPKITLPAIFASAVTGPLSTVVFQMENISSGAGMGTSGLVGQFGALSAMGYTLPVYMSIAFVHFIIPGLLAWIVAVYLRKIQWIKPNDMKLEI